MQKLDVNPRLKGKTYVVGVGVQKAGTSWLHHYLSQQPALFMSKRKEMHYFDTRFDAKPNKVKQRLLNKLSRQVEHVLNGEEVTYTEELAEAIDMVRMHYDDDGYPGYFARRVGDHDLFGEVTPAYCLIGAEGFAYMKSLFSKVKVIYLLRDPVDRHYSMLQMGEGRRGRTGFANRSFLPMLDDALSLSRADYRSQVEALRSVFAEDELFIGFYETLFSENEIRRLCDFIGIPYAAPDFATRINASHAKSELPPESISAALAKLAPVYDYCRRTFPDLPASWRA